MRIITGDGVWHSYDSICRTKRTDCPDILHTAGAGYSLHRLVYRHRPLSSIDHRHLLLFSENCELDLRHILHVDLAIVLAICKFGLVSVFEDDQFGIRHILHVYCVVLVRVAEDSECVV